jgi:hypothetical protein
MCSINDWKSFFNPQNSQVPFDVINLYNRFSGINKIVNVIGAIPEGKK